MDDCIFCRIVAGEIPCDKVYEDKHVIAFRDLHPVAPTHVLIVPRQHFADIRALSAASEAGEILAAVSRAADKIAAAAGLDRGFRLINNCGPDGGQSVPHVHFHLIGGIVLGERLL